MFAYSYSNLVILYATVGCSVIALVQLLHIWMRHVSYTAADANVYEMTFDRPSWLLKHGGWLVKGKRTI